MKRIEKGSLSELMNDFTFIIFLDIVISFILLILIFYILYIFKFNLEIISVILSFILIIKILLFTLF